MNHSLQSPSSVERSEDTRRKLEIVLADATLTDKDRFFLMETSILAHLTDTTCRAVVETGIPLRELRRRYPMLGAIDRNGNSFCIPEHIRANLLEILEDSRPSSELAAQHLKAAEALTRNDDLDTAIDHFLLAGYPQPAADLLAKQHGDGTKTASVEDLRRFDAPELDDYVPHLITVGLVHADKKNYPVIELMLIQLEGAQWDGPLPHGYANLEAGLLALRLRRPGSGRELLESVVDDPSVSQANASEDHHLTDLYRSAHFQYYLENFDAAAEVAEQILLGHLALGRQSLHDQFATILASNLRAILHHEQGERAAASAALTHGQELAVRYGVPQSFGVVNDVVDLTNAIVGAHVPAVASRLLRRLFQQGGRSEIQIQAGIELVRCHDQDRMPTEARLVLDQLDAFCQGRDLAPLHATRLAALKKALDGADIRRQSHSLTLTPAERVVLLLLTEESLTQIDISEQLGLSNNTVKSHMRSIHQKLGATSRAETIQRATELGLLATILPWQHKRATEDGGR